MSSRHISVPTYSTQNWFIGPKGGGGGGGGGEDPHEDVYRIPKGTYYSNAFVEVPNMDRLLQKFKTHRCSKEFLVKFDHYFFGEKGAGGFFELKSNLVFLYKNLEIKGIILYEYWEVLDLIYVSNVCTESGQGYGTELLKRFYTYVLSNYPNNTTIELAAMTISAQAFYERLGMKRNHIVSMVIQKQNSLDIRNYKKLRTLSKKETLTDEEKTWIQQQGDELEARPEMMDMMIDKNGMEKFKSDQTVVELTPQRTLVPKERNAAQAAKREEIYNTERNRSRQKKNP